MARDPPLPAAPVPDKESAEKAGDNRSALPDCCTAPETPRVPEPGVFLFECLPLFRKGFFDALIQYAAEFLLKRRKVNPAGIIATAAIVARRRNCRHGPVSRS